MGNWVMASGAMQWDRELRRFGGEHYEFMKCCLISSVSTHSLLACSSHHSSETHLHSIFNVVSLTLGLVKYPFLFQTIFSINSRYLSGKWIILFLKSYHHLKYLKLSSQSLWQVSCSFPYPFPPLFSQEHIFDPEWARVFLGFCFLLSTYI